MKNIYATEAQVTNTETERTVTCPVDHFKEKDILTVWIAQMKLIMRYNSKHQVYIGSLAGREFTSNGPKLVGRQR